MGRLVNANFPENYMMQFSGHKNIKHKQIGFFSSPMSDVRCTQRKKPVNNWKLQGYIYFDDAHDYVKVPSVFKIQSVVTSVVN